MANTGHTNALSSSPATCPDENAPHELKLAAANVLSGHIKAQVTVLDGSVTLLEIRRRLQPSLRRSIRR